jgi:hypothetical protein
MNELLTRETPLHVTSRVLLPVTDNAELRRYELDALSLRLQMIGNVQGRRAFDAFVTQEAGAGVSWQLEHVIFSRRSRLISAVRSVPPRRARGGSMMLVGRRGQTQRLDPDTDPGALHPEVRDALLDVKHMTKFSYRELVPLLGGSHTTLRAIVEANRNPRPHLAERIREVGYLLRHLRSLTGHNLLLLKRALLTAGDDGNSAADLVGTGDYAGALKAAERVLYPRTDDVMPSFPPLPHIPGPIRALDEED